MLTLTRPLVFFDLETTGLDKENDRIVQIAMLKVEPGEMGLAVRNSLNLLIHPGRPIPESASAIHGITDAVVQDCPPFHEVAHRVMAFLSGCDVAGYNSNAFDVPFLFNELLRTGFHWEASMFEMIDVGNLFKIKEARTLSAAVKFYCNRDMENAHNALADVEETVAVFFAQLDRYADLPASVSEMARYTNYGNKVADLSGKFFYDSEDNLRYNFGKHRGERVSDYMGFAHWMLTKGDFPTDTVGLLQNLLFH